jgi:hypothetical protein
MATTTTVRCPVLGADVALVTDFEGNPISIICGEYDEETGTCRLKTAVFEGGPLAQLLERTAEHTTATRGTACSVRTLLSPPRS